MAKGRAFTKEFKEDAVRYKKEHPELTLRQAASNLGISMSTLKHWMTSAKENGGPAGNMPLMLSKQLHVDESTISQGIILTTLLSLVTIPLVTLLIA